MHLAQFNLARLRAPLDDPATEGFTANLDRINHLADASPGFVWRLVEKDDAVFNPFEDEMVIVTMSVWESHQALFDFTYRTTHLEFLRGRRQWFEHTEEQTVVLWWVPEGHRPTVQEGRERLELLRAEGPGPKAFTFRERFEPEPAR
ncbi:DUF3291 domain-containing protein [Actinocorallia aurantiaca]|uniref:DUF3291 domain-containing protein n=1 Tax=Actinocorallia aurantiaca TaxID=46204 RepID=A0ABN3UF76_9ACTN